MWTSLLVTGLSICGKRGGNSRLEWGEVAGLEPVLQCTKRTVYVGESDKLHSLPRMKKNGLADKSFRIKDLGTNRDRWHAICELGSMSNENSTEARPGIGEDLAQILQEVRDTLKDVKQTLAEHGGNLQQQVNDGIDHAKGEIKDRVSVAKSSVASIAKTTRQYVQDRPYTCVAIGVTLGFLYGLSRRR